MNRVRPGRVSVQESRLIARSHSSLLRGARQPFYA